MPPSCLRPALLAAVAFTATACSPTTGTAPDDPFTCAAMISAADRLVATGRLAPDEALSRQGLVSMMTHLSAWAIPAGLPEKEAFARLHQERDRLTQALSPPDIQTRAHACIEAV